MAATPIVLPPRSEIAPGVWLDARLGVYFEAFRLLVVADLHWGYVESHRARGNLLPWWGDEEINLRLRALITDFAPNEMLWLGDSLHSLAGRSQADLFLRDAPVPVTVLAGNHDARWTAARGRTLQRGDYCFHHGDQPPVNRRSGKCEVVGHHHPAVSFGDGAGTRLKLPALVWSAQRIVLPAFSPWAAGTLWPKEAGETLWAISPRRVFKLPLRPAESLSSSQ